MLPGAEDLAQAAEWQGSQEHGKGFQSRQPA